MMYIFLILQLMLASLGFQSDEYQCTPCGNECDKMSYDKPGECPHCHMKLVKKSTVMYKSIQPSAVCGYISAHPEIVLLDVRTKNEYEGRADNYGTLKNAINIPIQELEGRVTELDKYKDREIIVYCSHAKRSARASYFLTQNGFKNVTNMEGGMSEMNDRSCKK